MLMSMPMGGGAAQPQWDGRGATPAPPAASGSGGGAAILAALLVGQAALVIGFFTLSIAAVWLQAGSDEQVTPTGEVPVWTATPEPTATQAPATWVAIVVIERKKNLHSGIVRQKPSMQSPQLGSVPEGAEVDVLGSCDPQTPMWCRIRTRGNGTPLTGWMHNDILRPR